MHLPEQGISGPFRITVIKHILPQKRPAEENEASDFAFQPVTGIFVHRSNDVWRLAFDSGDTLGVTYSHPIYSATAGDWRLAGELEIGEEVLTYNGAGTLCSKAPLPGAHTVYNLEVKDWHNFLVGELGVVVHNACWRSVREQLEALGVGTANHRNMSLPANRQKSRIEKPGSNTVAQKYGKDKIEICFDDLGFPDFNEWVPNLGSGIGKLEFKIDMQGNYDYGTGDFGQALAKLNSRLGTSFSNAQNINIPGYGGINDGIQWTFHHHQDGKTMQLVPSLINSNISHVGGASIMRNAIEKGINHWLPGPSDIGKYKTLCQ